MINTQDEVEVWIGNTFMGIVPKVSEPYIRQNYYGKPEEKKLIIKPRIQVSKEELNKLMKKLN